MLSAFGVDHGEISKNRWFGIGRAGRKAQQTLAAQRGAAGPAGPGGATKIKNALSRAGEANISIKGIGSGAGKGLQASGKFVERHPGASGTALVGGGGAAGYKVLSDKEPKRKKKAV